MPIQNKITTSEEIRALLFKRFPQGEFALIQEVRDKAGFHASRSADCIVVNLWPSRGNEVMGIEIKSYRYDWLREIKNPKKAEAFFAYCDRWWVVVGDDTVAKVDEVPPTWGLMVVRKGRLVVLKEAPKLDPEPLTKSFVAALLKRSMSNMIHVDRIEDRIHVAAEEARVKAVQETESKMGNLPRLQHDVEAFEKASGILIQAWGDGGKKGEAVDFLLRNGLQPRLNQLEHVKSAADRLMRTITNELEELQDLLKKELLPTNGAIQNNEGDKVGS